MMMAQSLHAAAYEEEDEATALEGKQELKEFLDQYF
eukprot:CAMPEP_0176366000 /NCGR_PEP_ID=MMETSP0126-20121128/20869_1 /TAXON_ID=141414 ORGANISM="Strombidinopsis acuminatum, Strain SPMC142" /NCGR_SAMPLE_ID=MMETSP0126 /ASSEMBLY_ACC=CAM_ASM_000229 /LENGTH=35 /DNA_ID= /DNA_START= /DNA_END= /DNA_ORIENTATION=